MEALLVCLRLWGDCIATQVDQCNIHVVATIQSLYMYVSHPVIYLHVHVQTYLVGSDTDVLWETQMYSDPTRCCQCSIYHSEKIKMQKLTLVFVIDNPFSSHELWSTTTIWLWGQNPRTKENHKSQWLLSWLLYKWRWRLFVRFPSSSW